MANFDTGQDLLRHLLRRVGQILPTSTDEGTADRLIDAKLYLTDSYWWVCAQRNFRWARKDPPFQFLSIAESLVEVTAIAGSTVTLSANLSPSMAGRKFILDSEGIPHRVSAHVTGTPTLTLVTAYAGDQTSGAARIFQDELTVATDILAFPDIQDLNGGAFVRIIPENELRALAPRNVIGVTRGTRYATFLTDSKIRIAPWTATARLFECAYNARPAPLTYDGVPATDTPIVPQNFRQIIAWRAEWKVAADRQDDKRAKQAKAEVDDLLLAMQGADLSFQRPRAFVPKGHRVTG
ncbi:MAG TPA: hypothetical protein VGL92_10990 [Acidimicrobiia bacterium]